MVSDNTEKRRRSSRNVAAVASVAVQRNVSAAEDAPATALDSASHHDRVHLDYPSLGAG